MSEQRFSWLVGSEVIDASGRRRGHVFDLHVEADAEGLHVTHLLVGRAGLLARLTLDAPWERPGEEVEWERVAEVGRGRVRLKPGT